MRNPYKALTVVSTRTIRLEAQDVNALSGGALSRHS
jgi:hypothetical protein